MRVFKLGYGYSSYSSSISLLLAFICLIRFRYLLCLMRLFIMQPRYMEAIAAKITPIMRPVCWPAFKPREPSGEGVVVSVAGPEELVLVLLVVPNVGSDIRIPRYWVNSNSTCRPSRDTCGARSRICVYSVQSAQSSLFNLALRYWNISRKQRRPEEERGRGEEVSAFTARPGRQPNLARQRDSTRSNKTLDRGIPSITSWPLIKASHRISLRQLMLALITYPFTIAIRDLSKELRYTLIKWLIRHRFLV